ncbi:MAG: C40 family peptidase [Gammaproteobacteria bacterium]|nr:C40 family peptidase [Gammaproteobacteria bacterium]
MLGQEKTYFVLTVFLVLLSACSTHRYGHIPDSGIDRSTVINTAKAQLGKIYKFGGDSPYEGFDCSGLVYYSYQKAGLNLPRTAVGQLKFSQPVSKPHIKQGDLVFFRIYRSRVSHVGIYLGANKFIHAPSTGKTVSIASLKNPYWQKRFIRAGRI